MIPKKIKNRKKKIPKNKSGVNKNFRGGPKGLLPSAPLGKSNLSKKARRKIVLSYKKIITLVVCLVLVAASTTAATVAWFTDTSKDVNTFVLGNVKMTLDEAKVDQNGVPLKDDRGNIIRTTEINTYHLVPGGEYTKDPTVTVKPGTSEAYVRILVTVSGSRQMKTVFGQNFLAENLVKGWDKNIWQYAGETDNGDNTVTYEFRYHKTVEAKDSDLVLEPLFEKILLPGSVTIENVETLANNVEIRTVAHGMQAEGFENADEAWAAFAKQKTI